MSRFIDPNGEEVLGNTAYQIVTHLRNTSLFCKHQDLQTFMEGMSKRLAITYSWHVRCDSPESFVEDLIENQWLRLPPTNLSD